MKIFSLFKNCKYIWGGKHLEGIDCSALIQIYFKFNNKFYPRDTVIKSNLKKGLSRKINYKSGDLIYWKGHVALCINSMKLIHAYGPAKKVVIMPIDKTIKIIRDTAGLKIKIIFQFRYSFQSLVLKHLVLKLLICLRTFFEFIKIFLSSLSFSNLIFFSSN